MRHSTEFFCSACLLAVCSSASAENLDSGRPGQMRFTEEFFDVDIIGGRKVTMTSFAAMPKWDRVRKYLIDAVASGESEILAGWVSWARGLRTLPVEDRLHAIQNRVQEEVSYAEDIAIHGLRDYWETPPEVLASDGVTDCEGYAILKYFLALVAGIEPEDIALYIGQVQSTREAHAVLWMVVGGKHYFLDNRYYEATPLDYFYDFAPAYSVDLNDIWLYRSSR